MSSDSSWGYGNSYDAILNQLNEERSAAYAREHSPDATDIMARVKQQHTVTANRAQEALQRDDRPHFFGIPVAISKPKSDGVDTFLSRSKESKLGDLWSGKNRDPHAGTVWGSNSSDSSNSFWGGSTGSFWGHKSDNNGGGWGW